MILKAWEQMTKAERQSLINLGRVILDDLAGELGPPQVLAQAVHPDGRYEFTVTLRARNFSQPQNVDPDIDPDCIATSGLQTGPKNRLRKMGILKFSELTTITRSRLLLERNLGKMGIQQIEWQMGKRGLTFAPEPVDNE